MKKEHRALFLALALILRPGVASAQPSKGARPPAAAAPRTAARSVSTAARVTVPNRAVGINESLLTTEAGPAIVTSLGEVLMSFADLSIRGRGLDFALTRHYRSLTLYFGPFGRNMDSPLFGRLRDLPSGDVDFYPGDGTRHTFRFDAAAKRLVAPKGVFLDLYRRPDGSFFLVYPDQTRVFFDADGRMTRLVDRNTTREDSSDGNAMNFFYDGAGRLAVVQDPTNRRITLSYYPDDASRGVNGAFPGLVSRVTDFDQRAVDYSYDADGRLVKVEGPEPGSSSSKKPKTTLAWTPLPAGSDLKNLLYRSGELRSITDGEDRQIFQVGYEPAGTASQIAFADGTWRFAWSGSTTAITDPLGNLTTYSHDEAGHAVAIVQPGSATTAYEYDDEGRLTAETRPMGGLIEYTYASAAGNSKLPMGNLIRIAESPRPGSPEASAGHTRVTTIAYGPANLPTALVTPDGAIVTVERDLRGNPISVRDGSGLTTSLSFNERGQVTATSDSRGNSTAHDYFGDGDGPRSGYQKSRTENGAATLYETDGRGNVVAVTDAAARRVTYSVNALDFVEGEVSPTGQKRYQYDASGNMTTSSAQSGVGADSQPVFVSESFSYDALHAVTSVAVPTGTTTYQYDSAHNLATVGLPDGKTVSYAYDSRNRIAARTAGGKTERYGYDLENNRTTVTSPNGKVTAYLFDGFGRLNGTTDPSGLTTVSLLDRAGRPAEAKVAGPGNKLYRWTVRDYDALGRVRSEMAKVFSAPIALNADGTLPPGAQVQDAVTTWTYDAFGNVLTRRDALGRTETSQYDAAGRLTKMADPAGNTIDYTYDAVGNRTKVRETDVRTDDGTTANFETTTEFDAENRAKKVTDTLGQSRSFTYDPRGNLLTETDADGNVTAYKYDEAGRRIEIDRPEGIVTKFVYDGNGNVTKAIDAQDKETRYDYDARNLVATITYPDGKSLTYGHDDDGNVVSQGESGGTAINFTTDNNGRPTARLFTRGPGVEGPSSETFTYDPLGRLVSADNGQAKVELNYDSLDRVTSEKLTTGGVSYTVTSAIDLAGNATGVTYPSGRSLVRTFDALDRLSSIQDGSSAIATYAYAGRERLARKTFGNGVSQTVAYDGARRPVGITAGSTLLDHRYGWTNTNRKAFTTLTGGKSDVYGYDRALRLVSEKLAVPGDPLAPSGPADVAKTFGYNAVNGLSAVNDSRVGNQAATNDLTQRLLILGGLALNWDAQGNLSSKSAGDRITYDAAHRPVRIEHADGSKEEFRYDALGRRFERSTTVAGTTRKVTEVSSADHVIAEYVNGTLDREYVWGNDPDELIQIKRDSDANGSLDQALYALTDELDTVHALTDSSGQPVERYRYESDGKLQAQAPDFSPRDVSLLGNTIGWQGRPWTGTYGYFRNRWLDSETRTWLTPDPAHYPDSIANAYAPFGRDGGVNAADPWGLWYQVSVREDFRLLTYRKPCDEHGCLFSSLTRGCATTIFVHGYRLDSERADKWAMEMESRLQKAGYRGSLISFTWPGNAMPLNADARRNLGGLPSGLYFGLDIGQARKSGFGLASLVRAIRREVAPAPKLSIVAHSLGAEALLAGLQLLARDGGRAVDTAIMAQAAVPPSYLMKGKNPIPRYLYHARGTGDFEGRIENTKEYEDWGRYADAPEAVALDGGIPALYSFYSRADGVLSGLYPRSGQPIALGWDYAKALGGLLPRFQRQIDTTPGVYEPRCAECGIGSHSAYIESPEVLTHGVFQELAKFLNK